MIRQRARHEDQKQERRQAILAAARQLFAQSGFDAVGMAGVAGQAGLAKGTLYLYFKTKEEMFLALLEEEFAGWFDGLDAGLAQLPLRAGDERFVALVCASLEQHPTLIRLLAILHTLVERNVDDDAALRFKLGLRQRLVHSGALIDERLDLAQGQGTALLLQVYALVIGYQSMADPAPAIRRVLAHPDLALLRVDLVGACAHSLTLILKGLELERNRHEQEGYSAWKNSPGNRRFERPGR